MLRKTTIIAEGELTLEPGKEWHSDPFYIKADSIVRLTLHSNQPHYIGVFDIDTYNKLRQTSPGSFPFGFGSDKRDIDEAVVIYKDSEYKIVVRLGVFNSVSTSRIRIEENSPPY